MSLNRVIYEINVNLHHVATTRYPWIRDKPFTWPLLLDFFQNYRAQLKFTVVVWKKPTIGWYKYNSDRDSRGNLGKCSIAFCIRNEDGDLMHAFCRQFQKESSLFA